MLARFYRVDVDADDRVVLTLVDEPVDDLAVAEGNLVGRSVRVSTRAVLVDVDVSGDLSGRAVGPLVPRAGTLCFDPSQGGIRTRENRRARGAFNALVAEANSFGMVNAFVHVQRAARSANRLLADLGSAALPPVEVVVGAHSGSRLPGYASGDGDMRSGELRPLSGGHYRLSTRTTGVPEPVDVSPTGEIHLGPCRYRKPFAGWVSYLRNAAHNPAIVYHEFGHHLCRHTADFRLNAERRPERQRNGKTGIEEGICDYIAAAMLGSGRPYGWYRADRGHRRDPDAHRHVSELDERSDAHAIGAPWAAAWWRCRRSLVDHGLVREPIDHDRVVVDALLRAGEVGRSARRRSRAKREARRSSPETILSSYLGALGDAAGPRAVGSAEAIFTRAGLLELQSQRCAASVASC